MGERLSLPSHTWYAREPDGHCCAPPGDASECACPTSTLPTPHPGLTWFPGWRGIGREVKEAPEDRTMHVLSLQTLTNAPLSHQYALTKHRFNNKIINNFKKVATELLTWSSGPFWVQGPLWLHWSHTRASSTARSNSTLFLAPSLSLFTYSGLLAIP